MENLKLQLSNMQNQFDVLNGLMNNGLKNNGTQFYNLGFQLMTIAIQLFNLGLQENKSSINLDSIISQFEMTERNLSEAKGKINNLRNINMLNINMNQGMFPMNQQVNNMNQGIGMIYNNNNNNMNLMNNMNMNQMNNNNMNLMNNMNMNPINNNNMNLMNNMKLNPITNNNMNQINNMNMNQMNNIMNQMNNNMNQMNNNMNLMNNINLNPINNNNLNQMDMNPIINQEINQMDNIMTMNMGMELGKNEINLTFQEGNNGPIVIVCTLDSKISNLLEKYKNKAGISDEDFPYKAFKINEKRLHPSLSLEEIGIQNDDIIVVTDEIRVKFTYESDMIQITCNPNETISKMIKKYGNESKIQIKDKIFIWNGQQLNLSDNTIKELGIRDDSNILVVKNKKNK